MDLKLRKVFVHTRHKVIVVRKPTSCITLGHALSLLCPLSPSSNHVPPTSSTILQPLANVGSLTYVAKKCTELGGQVICQSKAVCFVFTWSMCPLFADQVAAKPCTPTSNTECQCKEGFFCLPHHPCEVCKKCSKYAAVSFLFCSRDLYY